MAAATPHSCCSSDIVSSSSGDIFSPAAAESTCCERVLQALCACFQLTLTPAPYFGNAYLGHRPFSCSQKDGNAADHLSSSSANQISEPVVSSSLLIQRMRFLARFTSLNSISPSFTAPNARIVGYAWTLLGLQMVWRCISQSTE